MRHLASSVLLLILPAVAAAQGPTVPVPSSIKVEGMPPIPQSIADGLAQYGQFREAQLVAWHPTKRRMLITTTFGQVPQIHLVDGPGHARTQLTFFPAPGVRRQLDASFDPAAPDTFVFSRDPRGNELSGLYRFDLTTDTVSLVTAARNHYPPVFARKGKWLAYHSSERNDKDRDLYVIQPADPTTKRQLGDFDGAWSPEDWSADGTTLLAIEVFANDETYIWQVDVRTGAKTPVTPRGGDKAAWYLARYSADGRKIYALSDKGGDLTRVWQCDLATGAWTPVTGPADNVDFVQGFEISTDRRMMAVVLDRGVSTELEIIDLATLKAHLVPSVPKGIISRLLWRPGSAEVGFSLETLQSKGDAYSFDVDRGTVTRWTSSEVSFNPVALPQPELVTVKSSDGTPISAILYRPASRFTGPRPVVVTFHGGPDQQERIRFLGRSNYFLNELGVALLFPNVRGSLGSGRAFTLMDNGKGRSGAIADVGALLDWIVSRLYLDQSRVVFSGGSYGGWLALEAGIVYNDRIRGIIEGAGITNFVTYFQETDPARLENRRKEFGDERDPDMREYLLSISPITRAAELKKPTLIMHPGKDTRVSVQQAHELVEALKRNGATVWYQEFTNANHENFPASSANNDFLIASWMWFMKNFVLD